MPCYDSRDSIPPGYDDVRPYREKIRKLEAMLCAVLSVYPDADTLIRMINEKEAGITKYDLRTWWAHHQAEDAMRRKREAEKRRQQEVKQKALAKLSLEEKKALGLK